MLYRKIEDRYIDPFTDFGFKKLFGQECNKDLLLDFSNELFHKAVTFTAFTLKLYRIIQTTAKESA